MIIHATTGYQYVSISYNILLTKVACLLVSGGRTSTRKLLPHFQHSRWSTFFMKHKTSRCNMASTGLPILTPAPMNLEAGQEGPQAMATNFLQREWIVPPRPRPGRKPATDTPPTKRKAQNRAAQRAFRERRAAKTEEMGEQMREQDAIHAREREHLSSQIRHLTVELGRYQTEMLAWQHRCADLEREMLQQRRQAGPEPVDYQGRHDVTADVNDKNSSLLNCTDRCLSGDGCECLERTMDEIGTDFVQHNATIISTEPPPPESERSGVEQPRRDRQQRGMRSSDYSSLETDYTGIFNGDPSIKPAHPSSATEVSASRSESTTVDPYDLAPSSTVTAPDPCGFCRDGTSCICAQMVMSEPDQPRSTIVTTTTTTSRFTPPPGEGDVGRPIISVKPSSTTTTTSPQTTAANPCAAGPGTCVQCRSDPNRTLFCKSIAAVQSSTSSSSPSSSSSSRRQNIIYLSCADTYTTLSRHPHFFEAATSLDGWLGQLRTVTSTSTCTAYDPISGSNHHDHHHQNHGGGGGGGHCGHSGNGGHSLLEIEAASVMGVLRFFDHRFGPT